LILKIIPQINMNINSRIPRLDALRGVAILLVLGRHLPDGPQLQIFFRIWKTIGDLGMDLFFGLSGFLVGGILLREYQQSEGRVDLERFVVRRGFKIIPGYYLLIAFWFFTSNYWDNITPDLLDLIKHLFFIHNYTGFTKQIFQTWSLAVEEQFYLFLGGLFWILMTFKIKLTFRIRKGVYLWILLALACVLVYP
jgi:peptidoglycan/LPS O-acetylase OafA/YrhL